MPKEPSLRAKLIRLIMEKGYLSYGEFAEFVTQEGYKVSSGERRLRKSESPNIETDERKSRRGTMYIAGYSYKKPPQPTPEQKLKELNQLGIFG